MLLFLGKICFILNIIALIVAMIVGLIKKNRKFRTIQIYLYCSLLFYIVWFLYPRTEHGRILHNEVSNIAVILEVTLLYHYFLSLIEGGRFRICIYICYGLFVSFALYVWFGPQHNFEKFWVTVYGVENLVITIPCIFYFYQILKSEQPFDFRSNANFMVACGILFFYGATFPFYITYNTLYEVTPQLLIVFNIANSLLSSILFITITKAYLCPLPERK